VHFPGIFLAFFFFPYPLAVSASVVVAVSASVVVAVSASVVVLLFSIVPMPAAPSSALIVHFSN
jgi:hypothetical protein